MLVLTRVYERSEGELSGEPVLKDIRALIYGESRGGDFLQSLKQVYQPVHESRNFTEGQMNGDSVLPWIEAVFDKQAMDRWAVTTGSSMSLEDFVLQRYVNGSDPDELFSVNVREELFAMATLRMSHSPSLIGWDTPSWQAPAMTAFWTNSPTHGQCLTTGSDPTSAGPDARAFWDGHWATAGTVSRAVADGSNRHYRVHRFMRTPAPLLAFDTARAIFRSTGIHVNHAYNNPSLPSVFVHPFLWHAYQGDLSNGINEPNPAELAQIAASPPPLHEPRVLIVVDEFTSRADMMRGQAWEGQNPSENPDCYSDGESGAIKKGMIGRTVYELNASGHVLKSRSWEYKDGGSVVTTQGLGEEHIYASVGGLFLDQLSTIDPADYPAELAREIVCTERRSIGWSAAEANSAGSGTNSGLVEFFEYGLAMPTATSGVPLEDELRQYPWSTRLQSLASGVRKGTASEHKYYTNQTFFADDRPSDAVCKLRHNAPVTSKLTSPPSWSAAEITSGNAPYSCAWYVREYDIGAADPSHLDRPTSLKVIQSPCRQRPGGPAYYPVAQTFFDYDGLPEWTMNGLVRNPDTGPSLSPDPLERVAWTMENYGAYGRLEGKVIDVSPPIGGGTVDVQYSLPEHGGSAYISKFWSVDRFGQPWPRLLGPESPTPLHHATAYFYDREGEICDIIEPTRRWARRSVTDYKDEEDVSDDVTWEYVFAGLHDPTSHTPPNSRTVWSYRSGDIGRITKYDGRFGTAPVESKQVRFLDRVPISGLQQLPIGSDGLDIDFELLKVRAFGLDAQGRAVAVDELEPVLDAWGEPQMLQIGGRQVNDLGEVYRVWDHGGNVNIWTRNFLGQRLRRYEGTLSTLWGNEGILGPNDPVNGPLQHPIEDDYPQLHGYDIVLKERTEYGRDAEDVWQPRIERRYIRDSRESWAHNPEPDNHGGYHGSPPLADADAYVTEHSYDWRMRRVRTDAYELGDPNDSSAPAERASTTLRYLDFAGREVMTAQFGPLMPTLASALDPTQIGPDAVLPTPEDLLALSIRPIALTWRQFDGGGRVIEERDYDVVGALASGGGSPQGGYTRTLTFYGPGGEVFSISPGSGARITQTDALGRTTSVATVVQSDRETWDRELERSDSVYDADNRLIESNRWNRVIADGQVLDFSNAVRTRTWYWYDYNGRVVSEADLGTESLDQDGVSVYHAADTQTVRPTSGPSLIDSSGSWVLQGWQTLPASARITAYAYDEAGRTIAVHSPDGTVTTMGYLGSRVIRTDVNPDGPSHETRSIVPTYTEGRVTQVANEGLIGERSPSAGQVASAASAFGAPVVDDSFVVQSYDKTKPRYMGRAGANGISAGTDWEFEYWYDFLGRVAQRVDSDGLATRYGYNAAGDLRWIEIGCLSAGEFTPGYYDEPHEIIAADRPGFVEFVSSWSTDAQGAAIETRDIIARAARFAASGPPEAGRIVSHVRQVFNGRGQLLREYQELGQSVSATTPFVEYEWTYEPASDEQLTGDVRLARVRYPAVAGHTAREVDLTHDAAWPGEPESQGFHRLAGLLTRSGPSDQTVSLVQYQHAGNGMLASTSLGDAGATCSLFSSYTVGLDGYDAYGNLRLTDYLIDSTGESLFQARYYHDSVDRIVGVRTFYGQWLENTRSRGYAYDRLGRLTRFDVGSLDVSLSGGGGFPIEWTVTDQLRADAWHLDVLDNWNAEDPYGSNGEAGRLMWGNLDLYGLTNVHAAADPAPDEGWFMGITTASSDLDLLKHSIDGTLDPPSGTPILRDGLGRILCDGRYFYGYDAWGRLAAIYTVDHIQNPPQPSQLVRHFVYDGLGRLVRVQRVAQLGGGGPQLVSSERFYYDGCRRIVETATAPVYNHAQAGTSSDPELRDLEQTSNQEAGWDTDPEAANATLEAGQLEGSLTLLTREYVWGVEPGGGLTDELIAQFDGYDREIPWWVIQDETGDPAAIIGRPDPNECARVYWRGGFEPYGAVLWSDNPDGQGGTSGFYSAPPLRIGHKGLFVERLDAPPVVWGYAHAQKRLIAGADLLVLMRNRALPAYAGGGDGDVGSIPRGVAGLGRFLQPDPYATGVAVQPNLFGLGQAMYVPSPMTPDLESWTADALHAVAYARADPINCRDPSGLFIGGLIGLAGTPAQLDPYLDYNDEVLNSSISLRQSMQSGWDAIAIMQQSDAEWALDWASDDSDYFRAGSAAHGIASLRYEAPRSGQLFGPNMAGLTGLEQQMVVDWAMGSRHGSPMHRMSMAMDTISAMNRNGWSLRDYRVEFNRQVGMGRVRPDAGIFHRATGKLVYVGETALSQTMRSLTARMDQLSAMLRRAGLSNVQLFSRKIW